MHGKVLLTLNEDLPHETREICGIERKVLHFDSTNLVGKDLSRADFKHSKLTAVNFRAVILNGAQFDHAEIQGGFMDSCTAQGCGLSFSVLKSSSWVRADMYWASIFSCQWSDCNLNKAQLRGASIASSTFEYCSFIGTNFGFDNLGGNTRLQESKFLESDFTDADLSGIEVEKCKFTGSSYSVGTKFPKGFDPKRYQMKLRK